MLSNNKLILLIGLVCFMVGATFGIFIGKERGVPFVLEKEQWTIGIYRGKSPFDFGMSLQKDNPVLTAEDVTDANVSFVADPFLVKEKELWYLFFEVFNLKDKHGDIAFATSRDTEKWTYQRVILDEPFHLAYPYIFKWDNVYYMIPDTYESDSLRLYKADTFPDKWSLVTKLVDGKNFVDPSIVRFNGQWWIFVALTSNDTLRLYYAQTLTGPWHEHPQSPIIRGDKNIARPGGRVLIYDNRLFRYTQDADPTYGNQIWAFEITELSPSIYKEKIVSATPILKASGSGWNAKAMHTIDPHQIGANSWIAAVDGHGTYRVYGLQY